MKTDTVVGIAGAVILVVAMIGIFAYEANNEPTTTPGGDGDEPKLAERFLALGILPGEDLDNDGENNTIDADIDGDGLNNTADDEVSFVVDASGTLAAATTGASTATAPFAVGHGAKHWVVTLSYETTTPSVPGLPVPVVPNIALSVTGGENAQTCQTSYSGSTATCLIEVQAPAEFGAFAAQLSMTNPSPETAYTLSIEVHYGNAGAAPADPDAAH